MLGRVRQAYEKFLEKFEKFMLPITLGAFVAGIFIARSSQTFTDWVNGGVEGFVDGYGVIAPIAIFLILCPSLSAMFRTKALGKFGGVVLWWYFSRKILACVWAAIFTVIVFRFPILPQQSASVSSAILETLKSLGTMMTTSPYFWAMYLSVFVSAISTRIPLLSKGLEKLLQGVELGGRYFIPFIPMFMLAIGTYIYGLPVNLKEQMALQEGMENVMQPFSVWGLTMNPQTPWGMIWIYVVGALLVGLACFCWHMVLLLVTRAKVKRFTLKDYFLNYWIKIYPLLWSTSSEAISTPLNLYLTKRYAPWVDRTVRRFVVGVGSYMNINGTLICVYVLGGVVFSILGIQVSLVEWFLLIPVIVLISYGVPGIPGELVLFAGPIATMLNLPPAIGPAFIAIYVGLQIGLPDSFRTGNNSTDNYVIAILLNERYQKEYAAQAAVAEEEKEEEFANVA